MLVSVDFETMWTLLKLFSPLVKVLRRVDGDKPSIGFLYGNLEKAREKLKKTSLK